MSLESDSSRQLPLPGFEHCQLPDADRSVAAQGAEGQAAVPDERQLDLFAEKTNLEREIDHALASGEFEQARRSRDQHRETYGVDSATAGLDFLDALSDACARSAGEALGAWEEIDGQLRGLPALRERVREGVLRRLLASHAPAALARVRPSSLGAVASFLTREARAAGSDSSPDVRRLVRDALLAGESLLPGDVQGDALLSDLLAEDLAPHWLACLGAVRRLWPAPPVTERELGAFEEGIDRETAEDAALAFWQCLKVAETPGCPEELLHEARRRMKGLRGDLHALYLSHVRPVAAS